MIITLEDFFVLREQLPVADVRSENEFHQGHIPRAGNIPILNNAERVQVGTDYKQKGQQQAIKTGFRLVGPRIIDIVESAEQFAAGRELIVHCWRGGMRSANFCSFVNMARIKTYQLQGGYKAYRGEMLRSLERPLSLVLLGGYTGSGKSDVLRALREQGEQVLDLETLANHKGSVFGGLNMPPQPTVEQFQNDVAEVLRTFDPDRRIWVEDESITIGKMVIPNALWQQMLAAPVVELSLDRALRVERLVHEYGQADQEQFIVAMTGIMKKLGGQHFQEARDKWLAGQQHEAIDILLNYYDRHYGRGLDKRSDRIRLRQTWDGTRTDEAAKALATASF